MIFYWKHKYIHKEVVVLFCVSQCNEVARNTEHAIATGAGSDKYINCFFCARLQSKKDRDELLKLWLIFQYLQEVNVVLRLEDLP